ncbi:hypothetical protein HBI68_253890, partial [Parastagonospora nodorum]
MLLALWICGVVAESTIYGYVDIASKCSASTSHYAAPNFDEQSLGVQRVIAFFKRIRAGRNTVQDTRIDFQLAEGEYGQIASALQSDDVLSGYVEEKIRYDYDGDKRKLAVRMPTGIHERFIDAVEDDIRSQLKRIRNGSGRRLNLRRNKSKYEPNASFGHEEAQYPGVIIEVAYSQKKTCLDRLADNYILDSDASVQVVVCIHIEYNNKETKKATLSIWRPQLLDTPDGPELRATEVVADE